MKKLLRNWSSEEFARFQERVGAVPGVDVGLLTANLLVPGMNTWNAEEQNVHDKFQAGDTHFVFRV